MANAFYSGMACPDPLFTVVRWPSSDPVATSPALARALPVAVVAAAMFPEVPTAVIPAVKVDWAAAPASDLPPVAQQPFSAASFHFSGISKVAFLMPLFLLHGSDHFGQHVARAPGNEFRLTHLVEGGSDSDFILASNDLQSLHS